MFQEGDSNLPDVIDDPEQLRNFSDYGKVFNHQTLVMSAYSKVLSAGAEEMKKGCWQERLDKFGNRIMTYTPDTRKQFISSVMMLETVTSCDVVGDPKKKIAKIKEELANVKKRLVEEEDKRYKSIHVGERGKFLHLAGFLSDDFPYASFYVDLQVEAYRMILHEIEQGLKDMGYYSEDTIVFAGGLEEASREARGEKVKDETEPNAVV